jgi:hypothetical protein
MRFDDLDPAISGDHIGQLINGNKPILSQIEGFNIVRLHQFEHRFNAIFDITEPALHWTACYT